MLLDYVIISMPHYKLAKSIFVGWESRGYEIPIPVIYTLHNLSICDIVRLV